MTILDADPNGHVSKLKIQMSSTVLFSGANSSVISVVKRPKDNQSSGERCALHNLLGDKTIIAKKANKGTTTIIMSREQKIKEGQILLNNPDNYCTGP